MIQKTVSLEEFLTTYSPNSEPDWATLFNKVLQKNKSLLTTPKNIFDPITVTNDLRSKPFIVSGEEILTYSYLSGVDTLTFNILDDPDFSQNDENSCVTTKLSIKSSDDVINDLNALIQNHSSLTLADGETVSIFSTDYVFGNDRVTVTMFWDTENIQKVNEIFVIFDELANRYIPQDFIISSEAFLSNPETYYS